MRQVAIKEALSCIREIAKLRGLYPPRRRTPEPLPEPEVTPTNPHAAEDKDAEAPEASAPATASDANVLGAAARPFPHGYAPAAPPRRAASPNSSDERRVGKEGGRPGR